MGFHKLPSFKHYWSTDLNFKVLTICEAMPRNMFSKILFNIHLADNEKMPSRSPQDFSQHVKLMNLFKFSRKTLEKNDVLGENISIDESIVKFKGRSSLKQYLPMKPIKRGFPVWTLADFKNGYVFSFGIYKRKGYR